MPAVVFPDAVKTPLLLVHHLVGFIKLLLDAAPLASPGHAGRTADVMGLQTGLGGLDSGAEGLLLQLIINDHKFIPADAIDLFGENLLDLLGCPAEQFVSGAVAQMVVDRLEPVQVEVGDAQPPPCLQGSASIIRLNLFRL